MIRKINEKINYIDFCETDSQKKLTFNELIITKSDIIINCSKFIPKESFLKKLAVHQSNINRSLVIIISSEKDVKFNYEFNFVPTKKEAFDFILLERIERDLDY